MFGGRSKERSPLTDLQFRGVVLAPEHLLEGRGRYRNQKPVRPFFILQGRRDDNGVGRGGSSRGRSEKEGQRKRSDFTTISVPGKEDVCPRGGKREVSSLAKTPLRHTKTGRVFLRRPSHEPQKASSLTAEGEEDNRDWKEKRAWESLLKAERSR